jgi:hypothetical protein
VLSPQFNPIKWKSEIWARAPVFIASSLFSLRYEQERWPKIAFTDVKAYQKAAA